jgi:hypothetical protein
MSQSLLFPAGSRPEGQPDRRLMTADEVLP